MNRPARTAAICLILVLVLLVPAAFASSPRERVVASLLAQVPKALSGAEDLPSRVSIYGIECAEAGFDVVSFQDRLSSAIIETGAFRVVDRKSLAVLLEEQELALSGLVDDTGEMIQAGKLIGVQGFFFGTLELGSGSAILTLKLVEVESGAIVLSRKIEAVDPAFVQLGGGVAYTFVPIDSGADGSVDRLNHAVGFTASYRQGFERWTWGFVGVDLSFYRGFSQDPASVVSCAALLPRVYFRPGDRLGAVVTPWLGVAAEMLLYGVDATEPTALAAYPALGIDINPVRSITVYIEGGWRFADTLLKEGTDAWLARGPVLMAGMKLYFDLR